MGACPGFLFAAAIAACGLAVVAAALPEAGFITGLATMAAADLGAALPEAKAGFFETTGLAATTGAFAGADGLRAATATGRAFKATVRVADFAEADFLR